VFCVVELPPLLLALNPNLPPPLKNALHAASLANVQVVSCAKLVYHVLVNVVDASVLADLLAGANLASQQS